MIWSQMSSVDWMINRFTAPPGASRSLQLGAPDSQTDSETRTNTTAIFDLLSTDLVSIYVQMRMAAACHMPSKDMEAAAVLHYDVGEQITEHYDFIDPQALDFEQQIAKSGRER